MRISVLGSSSGGNASVINAGESTLLVDAGISARRIGRGVEACGLSLSNIAGIFITHEHIDHIRGLGVLSGKMKVNFFCSRHLRSDLRTLAPEAHFTFLEPGVKVQVGNISVLPMSVNHDALDPLGFVFEADGVRLGYITDTGKISREMLLFLRELDAIYLESNYDPEMLKNSGRPPYLIQRIESSWGHLSNEQAGTLIEQIAHPGLRHVILAHLSSECNTPDRAESSARTALSHVGCSAQIHIALRDERLEWVEV